jgi:RNA-splicing ligase RtcB
VYKLTNINLNKGEKVSVSKKHMFREKMTTRKLYPGEHFVEVQVNGVVCQKKPFLLVL